MSKKLQTLVDSDSRLESWELHDTYGTWRSYTISCDEGYIFNCNEGCYNLEFDTVKQALDFFSKNPNIIITEKEWRAVRYEKDNS